MEEMLLELAKLGPFGIVTAYFLWNDFQDRKAYREELRNGREETKKNREKISEHETRIKLNEAAITDIKEKVMQ